MRKQSLESNRSRFWCKSQKASWSVGAHLLLLLASPVLAAEFNLSVDPIMINAGEFSRPGIGYNGASPGPTLRMREGDTATIHVTNNLEVPTSIHWHGLILPFDQDGVPGISYSGIAPGETFTYRFPIVQSGTYWFHSHSGFQESDGAYGSIVIEPEESKQNVADREYIVQLTDKHVHSGIESCVTSSLKQITTLRRISPRCHGQSASSGEGCECPRLILRMCKVLRR